MTASVEVLLASGVYVAYGKYVAIPARRHLRAGFDARRIVAARQHWG